MTQLDLRDETLFRELPDPAKAPEKNGRMLCMDGSFADAYITKFRELRPERVEYSYSYNYSKEKGKRYAVSSESNSAFLELEKFVLDYLDRGEPIRRFPSSKQNFWSSDDLDFDLDYFKEMDGGPNSLFWNDIVNHCVLNEYRRELERWDDSLKWSKPFLKRRRTFLNCLPQLALSAVSFAAARWLFLAHPLELFPTLFTVLLAALGIFLLTSWVGIFSFKGAFRNYLAFAGRDENKLLRYYRYARFCQLWFQAEKGEKLPELLDCALDDLNRAVDRCQRILRFYPELQA